MGSGHVVLLGDSIFDNGAYVARDEPDVARQLKQHLPADWRATLCAVDGAVVDTVYAQLDRVPAGATHLVLSAGGNDALGEIAILDEPARSSRDTLLRLHRIRDHFARAYQRLLDTMLERKLPTVVCTIYEGNLPEPELQRAGAAALTVFNDVIVHSAVARGVSVVDLRLICDSPQCYANPIEPSAFGGDRIARAIARLVTGTDLQPGRTVMVGPA